MYGSVKPVGVWWKDVKPRLPFVPVTMGSKVMSKLAEPRNIVPLVCQFFRFGELGGEARTVGEGDGAGEDLIFKS
jgi:hypothetical protein